MIVCHCRAVTDAAIRDAIAAGAASLAEVARRTGAGRCCAPCQEEIAGMLAAARAPAPDAGACPELSAAAPL